MQPLKGLESLCLHLDAPGAPMHVSSLTLYDRSTAPAAQVEFADILRHFRERMHRTGLFRRRVVGLPLNLARPYWIDERDFDIEFHMRHIALPRPGDWRQLTEQVARLHARPLDKSRPLWECYVIDDLDAIPGVPAGSFALFTKAHYAALGGALSTQLFAALHELAPGSRASPPKEIQYFDRAPTLAQLAIANATNTLKLPLNLARWAMTRAQPLLSVGGNGLTRWARAPALAVDEFEFNLAPRTRFNKRVTPHRVVAGVRFERAAIESLRAQVAGATELDVVLAIVAGALREYLDGRLELPAASLLAETSMGARGLRVVASPIVPDTAIVRLHTDIDEPAERLRLIVAETRRGRADVNRQLARSLLLEAADFVPDLVIGAASDLLQRTRRLNQLGARSNTTISSLRGPDVPLYLAGARLVGYYGLPSLHEVSGLAHVIGTYDGALTIGVT
ncbi:MAG: wax ester/triacylglycerol synthase domain-containing protein, partial [Burkholderiaceae bacterium]